MCLRSSRSRSPVSASQIAAVVSPLPVAIREPSGEKCTSVTWSRWPDRVSNSSPVAASHTNAFVSDTLTDPAVAAGLPAVASLEPSGLNSNSAAETPIPSRRSARPVMTVAVQRHLGLREHRAVHRAGGVDLPRARAGCFVRGRRPLFFETDAAASSRAVAFRSSGVWASLCWLGRENRELSLRRAPRRRSTATSARSRLGTTDVRERPVRGPCEPPLRLNVRAPIRCRTL